MIGNRSRVRVLGGETDDDATRFTEEQIIAILKEQKAGAKTADLCRRHGISDARFYNWKAKYGWLEVSQARRIKALEDENARLKKLLAEAMPDNAAITLKARLADASRVRNPQCPEQAKAIGRCAA